MTFSEILDETLYYVNIDTLRTIEPAIHVLYITNTASFAPIKQLARVTVYSAKYIFKLCSLSVPVVAL